MQFNKTSLSIFCLFVLASSFLTACASGEASLSQQIKMGGSTTVGPAVEMAANAYMEQFPNVEITVAEGGSGAGIEGAATGGFHIGMASRNLRADDLEQWPDLQEILVARDGVAIVINRTMYDAGVTQLSVEQVTQIYTGEITNWQEVGGPDQPIRVFSESEAGGTRQIFDGFFLDGTSQSDGIDTLGANAAIVSTMSETENAIMYLSVAFLTEDVVGVDLVLEDGTVVKPTTEQVADGTYPVARDLNLIISGDVNDTAQGFLDYLLSRDGQTFFTEAGYIAIVN